MALIKKPSEIEVKNTLTALVYGQPGIGKSTTACSAPGSVLFDYDGGVNRMNGAHQVPTVQITCWSETSEALEELKSMPEIETIVIDTAGKMLSFMEKHIKDTNPKMKKADGTLSLQGYGLRKQMFVEFLKQVSLMGKNVIFVAHEIEQKRGDETIIRPEIGGSSANDLVKELDLVGYMEAIGRDRTISFDPCERFYGKNTCSLPSVIKLPVLLDEEGNPVGENTFFTQIIQVYKGKQQQNKTLTGEYEELLQIIRENAGEIETAEDANNFIEFVQNLNHIYNSKAIAGKLMQSRCAELGLKYNKLSKRYEAA